MRKVQEHQFGLGQVPIGEIKLDPKSRDDIPAVLRGLQVLYEERRSELWALLEANVCPDSDHRLGRPGMDLWRILVLGVLKQGLDCDFDRVHELANQHRTVRAMLCHGDFDAHEYQYQTVADNVALLTPELLREVNRLVVETGHRIAKKSLAQHCAGDVTRSSPRPTFATPPTPASSWTLCAAWFAMSSGRALATTSAAGVSMRTMWRGRNGWPGGWARRRCGGGGRKQWASTWPIAGCWRTGRRSRCADSCGRALAAPRSSGSCAG